MILKLKPERKKYSYPLRFEKNIPLLIYQSLTMISKNITDKFRIKMQSLSSTKILVTTNLSTTLWKKMEKKNKQKSY